MIELDIYAAFLIGLMGAGHCLGMCGGMASVVTISIPQNIQPTYRWFYLFNYNAGRLIAYALAGGIIGATLAGLSSLNGTQNPLVFMRIFSAIMMILLGLYIGQWFLGLTKIEHIGQGFWRILSPTAKRLLPLKSPVYALPFGFIWGWLPCGLVYSTLSWAAVSGSAESGAKIMIAFGLGTLPAMLAMGAMAEQLKSVLKAQSFRRISAILLILYGLHTGYIAIKQIMSAF